MTSCVFFFLAVLVLLAYVYNVIHILYTSVIIFTILFEFTISVANMNQEDEPPPDDPTVAFQRSDDPTVAAAKAQLINHRESVVQILEQKNIGGRGRRVKMHREFIGSGFIIAKNMGNRTLLLITCEHVLRNR